MTAADGAADVPVAAVRPADASLGAVLHDAWRNVTWREVAWTLGIALAFVLAHAYSLNGVKGRSWPVPVRSYEWMSIPLALLFLVAFRMAEHPRFLMHPAWRRYAIAVPSAGLLYWIASTWIIQATTEIHAAGPREGLAWSAVHVLMITVIVAVVYASLMRSARARAAFDAAELQRVATRRRLTEARLSALQAKVDPRFLFGTLELVEVLYERDLASAERTLAAMIDFLRTALPSGADEGSTVAREVRLVRDYLEIAGVRMGSRLQFDIRVDADVDAARCPAMILVPIVEDALTGGLEPMPHGGRLTLEAQRRGDRLVVSVAQSGVARRPPVAWLQSLRDRLAEIHGDDARLEVTGVANGTTTTLDVPYESTQGIVTSSVAASTTGEPA